MDWLQALILGLVQGLTEFLPVSSSGHLEIGKALLGINPDQSLIFTIAVHGATVLSTIVIFWKDIRKIIVDLFKFQWNESTKYAGMILISMIPAGITGLFFREQVESLFSENLLIVGLCLIVTAVLLFMTIKVKTHDREVNFGRAFLIGIAQAIAILPGLSRSGATISTGLFLKIDREKAARFSFLMVILPVLGECFLDIVKGNFTDAKIGGSALVIGFLAAFIAGLLACRWMVNIVKKGKLSWFAIYCLVIGTGAIIWSLAF